MLENGDAAYLHGSGRRVAAVHRQNGAGDVSFGRHLTRQMQARTKGRLILQRQIVRRSAGGEGERIGGCGHGELGVCAVQALPRELRRRRRLGVSADSTTLASGGATTEKRFGNGSL